MGKSIYNCQSSALGALPVVAGGRGSDVKDFKPGDVVYIEPNEEYWHGAAADRSMSHSETQEIDETGNIITRGNPTIEREYIDENS